MLCHEMRRIFLTVPPSYAPVAFPYAHVGMSSVGGGPGRLEPQDATPPWHKPSFSGMLVHPKIRDEESGVGVVERQASHGTPPVCEEATARAYVRGGIIP